MQAMKQRRLHISFLKRAPYLQSADLAIDDRLAVVLSERPDAWTVCDDHGQKHIIMRNSTGTGECPEPDPHRGRWVVQPPVPTYEIGERLTLSWRYRNAMPAQPEKPDWIATIVAESASTVTVHDHQGRSIELYRINGHQRGVGRREPRWAIVESLARANNDIDNIGAAVADEGITTD